MLLNVNNFFPKYISFIVLVGALRSREGSKGVSANQPWALRLIRNADTGRNPPKDPPFPDRTDLSPRLHYPRETDSVIAKALPQENAHFRLSQST